MVNLPDGIVTVHLGSERYRGAYYFRGNEMVLIDLVKSSKAVPELETMLCIQGSTTAICY
jgi:hypothetical protein